MSGPLSHVRVLDLSRIMAGPWASQVLADLGADVIKVERPDVGDDTRTWGPPYLTDAEGRRTGDSGYYLSVNRGKRSVALDLSTPAGQDAVRALAAQSDVVLENFKVGALGRYGLGYSDLCAVKPDLIYCSITGFGQTGPKRDNAAYDFMIQAMGGLMSVTGEPDNVAGGGPQKVGVPIVDIMTGMYAAVGVLAALAHRDATGEGDYIDLAMLDVQVGFLANQAMNYLLSGKEPRRNGNKHPNIQPQDVFQCRDGYLVLAVGNDGQFRRFATAIGRADLADDADYATNQQRVRNLPALHAIISAELMRQDLAHWLATLEELMVPCAPINTIPMALADEQVTHRKMLREIAHPVAGTVPQIVSPLRLTNSTLTFDRPPPLLGEHTDEVLRELGVTRPEDVAPIMPTPGRSLPRIPMFDAKSMTPEQEKVYEDIVTGPRRAVVGPLRAALHNPKLADRWQKFGAILRYDTSLPPRLSELAILVTARRWNAELEWHVHAKAGIDAGLPADAVEALRQGRPPSFADSEEADVYEFARTLQQAGNVPDDVYARVTARWGTVGVVELSSVIGYYTLVSMTLNVHEIPLPAGGAAEVLPPLPGGGGALVSALSVVPQCRITAKQDHCQITGQAPDDAP